jgi:hypothetical protein
MKRQPATDAMNCVLNALTCSVARYLRFGRPWVDFRADAIADLVGQVADSQGENVLRIGELLIERHEHVESRTFPLAFTELNDLSIECLLPLVIEDEKQIIALIESAAEALTCDPEARELVVEVAECERRHLQMLQSGLVRSYAIASDGLLITRPSTSARQATSERLHVSKPLVERSERELTAC